MKAVNKVELKIENFEKSFTIIDSDCPLGQLYDYSCALKDFVAQKIHEIEFNSKEKSEEKNPEGGDVKPAI